METTASRLPDASGYIEKTQKIFCKLMPEPDKGDETAMAVPR
jgi:hypothetical protein